MGGGGGGRGATGRGRTDLTPLERDRREETLDAHTHRGAETGEQKLLKLCQKEYQWDAEGGRETVSAQAVILIWMGIH